MGWDAPWHWVVVALLVIALFGYKKLPDASRSLGRSLRIFKTEIKGMSEDDKAREGARELPPPAAPVEPAAAPPAQPPASSATEAPTTVPTTEKPTTSAD